jgi:hypothetical protein
MKTIYSLLFVFVFSISFSQEKLDYPFTEFTFGDSPEKYKSNSEDISNPQALDEIILLYKDKVILYGNISQNTRLYFHNKRLFQVKMEFDFDVWDKFSTILTGTYGQAWAVDTLKEENFSMWGPSKQAITMSQMKTYDSGYTSVYFNDDYQKDFHFADLYNSSLFYIILIIVGFFVVYSLIVRCINSYCSRCKKFKMKYQGVDYSSPKNHDPRMFSSTNTVYSDTTYTYKCSNCKHIRKDHYKGFWKWFNSRK